MTAVAVKEKDGEQGERAKDIGLKRRRLHLLNITEHLLSFTKKFNIEKTLKHLLNISEYPQGFTKILQKHSSLTSFCCKTTSSVLQRVEILEADVPDEI